MFLPDYFKSMLLTSLLPFILDSCVEPFTPNINDTKSTLVVDGLLTDENPSATIKLSSSFQYNQFKTNPLTGAVVQILDEDNNIFKLSEKDSGTYVSDSTLKPVTGRFYKLRIVDYTGELYESSYEKFLVAPVIDSVFYTEYYNSLSHPYSGDEGLLIHAAAHAGQQDPSYYEWRWTETWEIVSVLNLHGFKPCWEKTNSNVISLSTTENLSANRIADAPLYFIPTAQTSKLSVRYNTRVKVISLTRENYLYLQKTVSLNSGSGGFFDPIPGALQGNINDLTDESRQVLGLFCASSTRSMLKVIPRDTLHISRMESGFSDCDVQVVKRLEYYVLHHFYNYFIVGEIDPDLLVLVNLQKCADCSFIASPFQPDDWQ